MQKPADFRMPQCDPARQLPRRLDGYRDDYAHGLSCNGRSMRFRSIREAGWPAARRQTARRGGAAAIGYPLRTVAVSTSFCRSIRRRAPCRRQFEQDPMALQNRVTPFGDIAAIPQRGMFTRNRGIIHDPATRTLLKRRWASKAWLTCVCEFKGRHRDVMARRSWTELFFLDERSRLRRVTAPASSAVVKPRKPFARFGRSAERSRCRGRRKWTRSCTLSGSTTDASGCTPCRVLRTNYPTAARLQQRARPTFSPAAGRFGGPRSYEGPLQIPRADALLTPPSTLGALRAGYRLGAAPEYRYNAALNQ